MYLVDDIAVTFNWTNAVQLDLYVSRVMKRRDKSKINLEKLNANIL